MQDRINKILETFKELTFEEESHKYTYKGKILKHSVSNIIGRFSNFNSEKIAKSIASATGKDHLLILKEWEEKKDAACKKGTEAHLFGEQYAVDKTLKPNTKLEEGIVKFWNDLPSHIVPVLLELPMVHFKYLFGAMADILLYNTKKNTYIIGDYKTNEDLFKNYKNQKLFKPFDFLLNNPFNKYQLQLSLYQMCFEQTGFKVDRRKIIWLLPNGSYELYETEDYTKKLKKYLKDVS